MKPIYCPCDTHEKEQACPYYEQGAREKLGCWCKHMHCDSCFCLPRLEAEATFPDSGIEPRTIGGRVAFVKKVLEEK